MFFLQFNLPTSDIITVLNDPVQAHINVDCYSLRVFVIIQFMLCGIAMLLNHVLFSLLEYREHLFDRRKQD